MSVNMVLYLGGTRSGKSVKAEERVFEYASDSVFYVATAQCFEGDESMFKRILRHRERRSCFWQTLECPRDLPKKLEEVLAKEFHDKKNSFVKPKSVSILIDCVTLWVSNIMFSLPENSPINILEDAVMTEFNAFVKILEKYRGKEFEGFSLHFILVSGEVGLGGIGASKMERDFADLLGMANQFLAKYAEEVFLVVAGRSLVLD